MKNLVFNKKMDNYPGVFPEHSSPLVDPVPSQLIIEYEAVNDELMTEVALNKTEYASLRNEIEDLQKENKKLHEELSITLKQNMIGPTSPRHRKGLDLVTNLQRQLALITMEKDNAVEMWEMANKQIGSLEEELKSYQENKHVELAHKQLHETKQEYSTAILLLEEKITTISQEAEIERISHEASRNQVIVLGKELDDSLEKLAQRDKEMREEVETTNTAITKIQELEEIVKSLSEDKKRLTASRDELEAALIKCHQQIEYLATHSQVSHDKVEEALIIADAALADREASVNQATVEREENMRLKAAMNNLIQEASLQVQSELAKLKQDYSKKLQNFNTEMKKLEVIIAEKVLLLERSEQERHQLMAELTISKNGSEIHEPTSIMQQKIAAAYRELTESERRNHLINAESENLREKIQVLKECNAEVLATSRNANAASSLEILRLEEQVRSLESQSNQLRTTLHQEQCGPECQEISRERNKLAKQIQEIKQVHLANNLELERHMECQQTLINKWQSTSESITLNFESKLRDLRTRLREASMEKRELQKELNEVKREIISRKDA